MNTTLPVLDDDLDLFGQPFVPAPRVDLSHFTDEFLGEDAPEAAPVVHRCGRCGRKLTDPKSVARGYGRTCSRRIDDAIQAVGETFKPHQIASATQLIEDGGLVVGPHKVCLAVSSDGSSTYVVDAYAQTCTCTAGSLGRRCYHLATALVLAA